MAELSRVETKTAKSKKRIRRKKAILFTLVCVLLFLLAGGVYAYIKLDNTIGKIATDSEPKAEDDVILDSNYSEDPFAMLILGKDTREEDQGLKHTDVMILAVVQPKEKHISMLSIPRDTRVVVPEFSGHKKITEAYAYGDNARIRAEKKGEPIKITGISTVKKTVEGLLGIPVKNYITVDFEGFKKVIDDLGGIEVDVERRLVYHDPSDDTNIDLQPGVQTLDGEEALGYVRHRKDDRGGKYYSSDSDRNIRQQLVISKVADKIKSFTGLTHLFDIMDTAGDHIRTDLSKEQIKGLAFTFKSISSSNFTTIKNKAYWDSDISFTVFPEENLNEIRHTLWNMLNMTEAEGMARVLEDSGLAKAETKKQVSSTKSSKSSNKKTESASENQESRSGTPEKKASSKQAKEKVEEPKQEDSSKVESTETTSTPTEIGTPPSEQTDQEIPTNVEYIDSLQNETTIPVDNEQPSSTN